MGADDRFFGCVRQGDDSKGQPGAPAVALPAPPAVTVTVWLDEAHFCAPPRPHACSCPGLPSPISGIHLDRSLMTIAGRALQANLMRLAPRVLPLWELALVLANLVERKVSARGLCLPPREH